MISVRPTRDESVNHQEFPSVALGAQQLVEVSQAPHFKNT